MDDDAAHTLATVTSVKVGEGKKSEKSLKEKRAVKRAKTAEPSPTDDHLHLKKR